MSEVSSRGDVAGMADVLPSAGATPVEHAEFVAEPSNAALIRALIAAAASNP